MTKKKKEQNAAKNEWANRLYLEDTAERMGKVREAMEAEAEKDLENETTDQTKTQEK